MRLAYTLNMQNSVKSYLEKVSQYGGILDIKQTERINSPMRSDCKASVVIPVYNESRIIERCLDSLLRQSIPVESFEVVIVNNNSTDDTANIITQWIKTNNVTNFFLVSETRKGVTAARKRGFDETVLRYIDRNQEGEHFILSADADNEIDKDWIKQYLTDFVETKADLLCGESFYNTDELNGFPNILNLIAYKKTLEQFLKGIYVGRAEGNNFGLRLSAYTQVGGFKVMYMYGEKSVYAVATDDWCLSAELIAASFQAARSKAKVSLNGRKFVIALEHIIGGTLYAEGWEEHASGESKGRDLTDSELVELKQSQLRGIVAHQLLINIVANPIFLELEESVSLLGSKLSQSIRNLIPVARSYCGKNSFSTYVTDFWPAYFMYFELGRAITAKLSEHFPELSLTFSLPSQISNLESLELKWDRYLYIMGFLYAPDEVLGKYFGSWI